MRGPAREPVIMLAREQALQILRAVQSLPADKVREVQDFIAFLQLRYGPLCQAEVRQI